MTDAFYEQEADDHFISTQWTRGPWGPDSQHGGPPAALLGRAVERANDRAGMHVARIAFDFLRPVPVAPLVVSARVVKPGQSAELIEATLSSDSELVMRATAWRMRTRSLDLIPTPGTTPPPVADQSGETESFPTGYEGYLQAMEWRFVSGAFLEQGPAVAWLRMRMPLVAEEPVSPLTRVLIAADSSSGISAALDFGDWVFVNPDLSVYLTRPAAGEWVCLDAITTLEPLGTGLAASQISDEHGPVGRSLQTLFITPRERRRPPG